MRLFAALSIGLATGIFTVAGGVALTGSPVAATLAGVVTAAVVAWLLHRSAVLRLDPLACPRWLVIASGLLTPVALLLLARLAVFMVEPSRVGWSINPASTWEIEHSCTSAYFVAAQASATSSDFYDHALYSLPDDDPAGRRKARSIGPFKVDVYEYPPQFLLLPRALMLLAPEFLDFRMLWFALNGGVFLIATVVVARFMGPAAGTRALLLSTLLWLALPATLSTLQKGNIQVLVIAASMLAMVLFERGRPASGGAILALMTVSKLYPGMLVVYLMARRQWRATAWTVAFGGVYSALALVLLGWESVPIFLDHLPGLLGGEAFPAFRNPAAMAVNQSIPGLIFKLKLFGVPGMSFGASKIVGWAWTLVVLAATVVAARRPLREDQKPLVWLAILILATLRSPFLPVTYAVLPPLWLLTLAAAARVPAVAAPAALFAAWAALNVYWPMDWPLDPRLRAIACTLPQVLTVMLVVLVLRRARQPQDGGGPFPG